MAVVPARALITTATVLRFVRVHANVLAMRNLNPVEVMQYSLIYSVFKFRIPMLRVRHTVSQEIASYPFWLGSFQFR